MASSDSRWGFVRPKTDPAEGITVRTLNGSISGQEAEGKSSPNQNPPTAEDSHPRYRLAVWSGSVTAVNAGLKVAFRRFYAVASVGGINLLGGIQNATAYGLQLGFQFPVDSVFAAVDAGYTFMDNGKPAATAADVLDQNIFSFRGLLGFKFSANIAFFMGTGMVYAQNYGKKYYKGEVVPIFFAGFELF